MLFGFCKKVALKEAETVKMCAEFALALLPTFRKSAKKLLYPPSPIEENFALPPTFLLHMSSSSVVVVVVQWNTDICISLVLANLMQKSVRLMQISVEP